MLSSAGYKKFIEDHFDIVDKKSQLMKFELNDVQNKFLLEDSSRNRDVILKARKMGFSSLILAMFTKDFLLRPFSKNVIVADDRENAETLLERVKLYIESYESRVGYKIPMKYNTKNELYNELNKSTYRVGTAQNVEFGRSKDITNLHFSEAAFYPQMKKLFAGALQAVTDDGYVVIETTANGLNEFKDFWDDCKRGKSNFKPIFYGCNLMYDKEFLATKKLELQDTYPQEYPEIDNDAFLASGSTYFDRQALTWYTKQAKEPIREFKYGFYDLL